MIAAAWFCPCLISFVPILLGWSVFIFLMNFKETPKIMWYRWYRWRFTLSPPTGQVGLRCRRWTVLPSASSTRTSPSQSSPPSWPSGFLWPVWSWSTTEFTGCWKDFSCFITSCSPGRRWSRRRQCQWQLMCSFLQQMSISGENWWIDL